MIENIYQFKCIKTVNVNPADVTQTQQTQETIYGGGPSMVEAIENFGEVMKGQRMEIMAIALVGQKAF